MGSKNKIKEYTTCTGKTPSCIVGTPDPVQDDSARWSTEREFVSGLESAEMSSSEPIARAGFPMDVIDGRVYFDPGEAHTIAFGSTGSGKTNYIASPSIRIIARSGESLFVNDPKGDLSRDNYDYLVLHGYTVFVFHGRRPSISRRWNPLEIPYRFYHSENVVDRDEAQNMTPNQVKGIITRAGAGTKIILLGDPNQIDKSFLNERTNGLSYAAKYMKGSPLCWQITLSASECERSELAMDAIQRL